MLADRQTDRPTDTLIAILAVTHDQTDQTDAMPPTVSFGRTTHSSSTGSKVQK